MTSQYLSTRLPSGLGLVMLVAGACSSPAPLDIGDENVNELGFELSDYAASWDGYAEAYTFLGYTLDPDTDRVRLTVDANGNGALRFGDADLFPPPSDPDSVYPPATNAILTQGPSAPTPPTMEPPAGFVGNWASERLNRPTPGIAYPVQQATIDQRRLRLRVYFSDAWKDWCALQRPRATGIPSLPYNCVPGTVGRLEADSCVALYGEYEDAETVSCAKYSMCVLDRACQCSADSCTSADNWGYEILDAALSEDGTELEGTLADADGDNRIPVRMTK